MCLQVLAIGLSIAGSFMQAAMQAQLAKQQAEIQRQQLQADIENEANRSKAAVSDRIEQMLRAEATNRAAIAASGVQNNLSYEQGIAPYNKKVAYRDVEREQYNSGQLIGRKKYEIGVAQWKAKATAVSGYADAFASSISSIGSAFA